MNKTIPTPSVDIAFKQAKIEFIKNEAILCPLLDLFKQERYLWQSSLLLDTSHLFWEYLIKHY